MTRLLVVDDEQSIRRTFDAFLRGAGYAVETAENVEAARSLLEQGGFDIVVTDILMPGVTGVELLKILRQTAPDIQVLLMTGEPTVETAAEAVRIGAFDYLSKPVSKSALLRAVGAAARIHELAVEKRRLEEANAAYQMNLEQWVTERTEALQKANQRLERNIREIVDAMGLIVEYRDPYTAGHQQRVAQLAQAIAEQIGLSADQISSIVLSASIHDLGKIGIPAEILTKPSRLNAVEMELVRMHARIGYEILSKVEFQRPIAEMVFQHHERLDGSGYPRGLKRDQILIEARVIGVADVVEAMASHRPYRPALGSEIALAEIRAGRDAIYDPQVVDACLHLFEKQDFSFS